MMGLLAVNLFRSTAKDPASIPLKFDIQQLFRARVAEPSIAGFGSLLGSQGGQLAPRVGELRQQYSGCGCLETGFALQ